MPVKGRIIESRSGVTNKVLGYFVQLYTEVDVFHAAGTEPPAPRFAWQTVRDGYCLSREAAFTRMEEMIERFTPAKVDTIVEFELPDQPA